MGLNVAQEALAGIGGSLQLRPRAPCGVSVSIEIPASPRRARVVWLETAGIQFALPTSFAGKASLLREAGPAVSLSRCLGLPQSGSERFSIAVVIEGVEPVVLAVDRLGPVEHVRVRSIPTFAAQAGPYTGAVLRRDNSLALVIDPALLAARAWALVA
jgi:chemotaxis protein histidine kinase CheA